MSAARNLTSIAGRDLRWHNPSNRTGYSLVEADDPVAMGKWSHQWSDLLTIETNVVVDDAEFLQIVG